MPAELELAPAGRGPLDTRPSSLGASRSSADPLVGGPPGDGGEGGGGGAGEPTLSYEDFLAARASSRWSWAPVSAWLASRPHPLCNVPSLVLGVACLGLVLALAGRGGGGRVATTTAPHLPPPPSSDASLSPEGRLAASAGVATDYRGRPRSLLASRGAVATDHGRCSEVGASILKKGGNAADAAVAAALCLGVHNPMASGIGGGALIIVREPDGRVAAFDAREAAPAAASQDMYGDNATASLDGGAAVGVPGELWGLHALFTAHGSGAVGWAELVEPAAAAARTGFPAHPYLVAALSSPRSLARLSSRRELAEAFLIKAGGDGDGGGEKWRAPRVNETCCARPALADTLDAVARGGPAALYTGPRAASLAADVRAAGGILTEADLGAAAARAVAPLKARAWGLEFFVPPPPSAGGALLAALAIAAGWEAPLPFERGLGAHRLVEAMKHGMALRAGMGDPGGGCVAAAGPGEGKGAGPVSAPPPSQPPRRSLLAAAGDGPCLRRSLLAAAGDGPCLRRSLLAAAGDGPCFPGTSHVRALLADAVTPAFADALRASIADNATQPPLSYGGRWGVGATGVDLPPEDHGTSHLSVVDGERRAVSLTTTINTAFGSGVLSERTGILLNNQMDDFSRPGRPNGYGLPPGPANFIAPGKKPLSSMVPLIAADPGGGGGLRLVLGGSGGPRILTAVLQASVRLVAFGEAPLAAVAAPRLHHQILPNAVFAEDWAAPGGGGLVEKVDPAVLASLRARGHDVKPAEWGGVVQAIVVPPPGEPGGGGGAGGGASGGGSGGGPLAPVEAASDPRKDGAPAGVD